jgi:hypothetical protein
MPGGLPDGGTIIGGSFTRVNDTPRSNLAAAGEWHADPNWNASTNNR